MSNSAKVIFLVSVLALCSRCSCYRTRIPIGVLVDPSDRTAATVVRHTLWAQTRKSDWPKEYVVEVLEQEIKLGDAAQIDRAVCRLLRDGIYALVSPTDPLTYKMLVSYSNEYALPLISPSFPEAPVDLRSQYGISAQPSTTRSILDLLRFYKWEDIIYLYDSDDGPEALQKIYQLGYRVLRMSLLGILRTTRPEDANGYLRKLDSVKKHRSFYVILDMNETLAREIIIRHVHDIHVGKTNFHFLVKKLALEEFWASNSAEFGTVNVTGFLALSPEKEKKFQETWKSLPPEIWKGGGTTNLNISAYFYHDASLTLAEGLKKLLKSGRVPHTLTDADAHLEIRDCLQEPSVPLPNGRFLAQYIKQSIVEDGLTGRIQYDTITGERKSYMIQIVESSHRGNQHLGTWSDSYGLRFPNRKEASTPESLPRRDEKKQYRIASVLSPPFMMIKKTDNNTEYFGNDRYEGYCKDMIELLVKELKAEYQLYVLDEAEYGKYDETTGEWTGTIGELIRGKVDIVVADLHITGLRQRVVDFADPFAAVTFSVLMKNPQSTMSSPTTFFFLSAFSTKVWICIIVSAVAVAALFYFMSKFTGSPDNIEAASRVWGKRFTIVSSTWFTTGSALLQGTGIYPRSLSSRILGGTWWCFSLIIIALYIASLTSQLLVDGLGGQKNVQLNRLYSMSLESIIKEAVTNDWPQIGILSESNTKKFIKQSTIPAYIDYVRYLKRNPDVAAGTVEEGVNRVRNSNGNYAFLMESLASYYYSAQEPCDVVSIHDNVAYTTYGIAVPLWSPLKFELNEGLRILAERGDLGNLHRKWFIERSHCNKEKWKDHVFLPVSLLALSGLFYFVLLGLAVVCLVGAVQYYFRARKKEERCARLSFEEMAAMEQTLPLPPPELLMEQPSEDDNGAIDGWAERKLVPTSFSRQESHPTSSESKEEK